MGEPSSSWQNFNFRDDEGSAQGMQALRLLLAKLQEAQANPRLKPSVNNLLMTEDLMLTSTQRLPSSVAPMHLEGGEGVPVMHGPMQANVVPHPLQGPLQTDGAKKKQYHGQERHVEKIREEGDFHDDDDEPPSRSRHKKRTNERRTKRSRRNSSGGSSSSSQSGRSSHGRFPKKGFSQSSHLRCDPRKRAYTHARVTYSRAHLAPAHTQERPQAQASSPSSMATEDGEPAFVDTSVTSVAAEKLHDFPALEGAGDGSLNAPPRFRLFNRQRPVHEVLGGGQSADVILWRNKYASAGILVGTTLAWILLEHSGFSLLTIVSDVLLILIGGLFVWANAATLFNKRVPKFPLSPPRIPELHMSEDMVINFASSLRVDINKALAIAHDIALGKDLKVFLKVVAVLWGLSLVGGWFHFLTLIYICVVFSHSIPVIYERYEEQIDSYTKVAMDKAQTHYRTLNEVVAKMLPKNSPKAKKLQ
ncbi:hypothetical protein L7F22_034762 [Adiantum nelumboides]|nr:hypothetical protein [Adiantum nelumboides]